MHHQPGARMNPQLGNNPMALTSTSSSSSSQSLSTTPPTTTNTTTATTTTTTSASSATPSATPEIPTTSSNKIAIPRLNTRRHAIQRPRTSRACVPCHDRKAKCDGRRPTCRQCLGLEIECSWAWSKREREDWELESARSRIHTYEALLGEILDRSSDPAIHEVFARHFQSAPDVLGSLFAARPLSGQQIPLAAPGISLRRMHLAWASIEGSVFQPLSASPPFQTSRIQDWIPFVDNDTASHLLSLYFAWENPVWNLVDKYMFHYDLEHGGSKFCSPLLVHVLLFFGVSISYDLAHITNRREEKFLGKRLYTEIQRLWQQERNNANLPTTQSGILIGLLCCTFGIDRIGTGYILHGAELGRRFGLDTASTPYFTSDNPDLAGPLARCHRLVAWAVFDIQALAAQVYRKGPLWVHPPLVRFVPEEAAALDNGDRWSPYPFTSPLYSPCYYTTAWARSILVEIVHSIALFVRKFPDATMTQDDWEYGAQLYQRLMDWTNNLPSTIQPNENASPNILCLHMYHKVTVVALCDAFNLFCDPTQDRIPTAIPFAPLDAKSDAMETLGSLVLLFKQCHGWKSIPIVMLHYFCVAGVHAISHLERRSPKWNLVLESCVVGLWYMSLGWGRLCTAFLRIIHLVLKAAGLDPALVPVKVLQIFNQLDQNMWTARDVASLSADYVVQHVPSNIGKETSVGSAYRAEGLESLIHALDDLSVRGDGGRGSSV
ncbi:hypothetical protein FE257_006267 [Aspergillus nanangensis]|uniref:Zn(2)-C6 fungal-type domain-containing protein n=1 Tax=Aspergillus nanangensis TaxID=2582783 RepID=A0AAD4CP72_ASPNN|nr:hypothetical protein FE257_006267 [Aspergillus nanangensis]